MPWGFSSCRPGAVCWRGSLVALHRQNCPTMQCRLVSQISNLRCSLPRAHRVASSVTPHASPHRPLLPHVCPGCRGGAAAAGGVLPPHQQGRLAVLHAGPRLAHLRLLVRGPQSCAHAGAGARAPAVHTCVHVHGLALAAACRAERPGLTAIPSTPFKTGPRCTRPTCQRRCAPPPCPQMDSKLVGPPIPAERLFDCVNVVLSYQNGDGGWATYENKRSFEILEARGQGRVGIGRGWVGRAFCSLPCDRSRSKRCRLCCALPGRSRLGTCHRRL